jgi:acetylornithine/succinyldiaminopimelate/putrescine aminotransferase
MSRVLHRNLRSDPAIAATGDGLWLRAAEGWDVIDASGGAAVACLGHGNRRVIRAMMEQAERLSYAHTVFFTCDAAEELADLLVGEEPGGLARAYFVSSGSEAMEAALKLSRQYFLEIGQPQRWRYIARRQSYHGNTLGALGLGGNMARREPYAPILADCFSHVSPCFAYRGQEAGESGAEYVARLAAELEAEFQRLGPDSVIAFVAETVVGATTGCVTALPGYFAAMRAVCDRHGALLILDEVMCGMGRTGTLHAWEQEGVAPDIQTVAKGLGGGYQPIGGVLAGAGSWMRFRPAPAASSTAIPIRRIQSPAPRRSRCSGSSGRTGCWRMCAPWASGSEPDCGTVSADIPISAIFAAVGCSGRWNSWRTAPRAAASIRICGSTTASKMPPSATALRSTPWEARSTASRATTSSSRHPTLPMQPPLIRSWTGSVTPCGIRSARAEASEP